MTCTNREMMGHGEGAVCGKPYYNEIWLCGKCKLKKLEAELATARQEATAYRISLENAEQLIFEFIECRVEVGDTWGVAYGRFNEACKKAKKLEAGE